MRTLTNKGGKNGYRIYKYWKRGGGLKGLTATPNDVKQGLTFSRDGKTVESGTLNLNNLRPENIKAGVNIGGVVGQYIDENFENITFTSNNHGKTFICSDPKYSLLSDVQRDGNEYYWRIRLNGLSFKPKGALIKWQRYKDDPLLLYAACAIDRCSTIYHNNGSFFTFSPFHGGFGVHINCSVYQDTAILHTKKLNITII